MHSSSTTGFVNPSSAALSLVPDAPSRILNLTGCTHTITRYLHLLCLSCSAVAAGIAMILRRVHSIHGMYKVCILALFLSFLLIPLT